MRFAKSLPLLATLLATLLLPLAASAHVGVDGGMHHGFSTGFLHPLTGADHLAAMVAVGFWSALSARRAWPDLLWAPLAFAGMLLVGALMGLAGVQLPAVEPMIAASLLVLGLLVATRVHLPAGVAMAVVGAFAVFHGVAHGHELANEDGAARTLAGMVGATVLLHGAGIALGWSLRHANAWLPRVAGAAVVGLGATLLAQAI
ncbi:HupE/UreJ family protein [Variovorax sp. J22G73]|jgi:urease accessory protein|uniref:HupE/UreJ family protein n=1 Tax=unclassified Variovorax TaxID=663243 RepID=UPI000D5EA853|nr:MULTISPECIES: HupE/UreJ family protein [unclassified Variovorax]MDM0007310.1 HupE/UreJ family protein [Variovorax sp. J22R203]MDM0098938.1 HupE/UreJ family protein [Variovorax sp. J22G73]